MTPTQRQQKDRARAEAEHHQSNGSVVGMRSAEDQLAEDRKVVERGHQKQTEMDRRRFLFGGGKENYGLAGMGQSDESMASNKKETDDYEKMSQQQYLLRKKREYKESK